MRRAAPVGLLRMIGRPLLRAGCCPVHGLRLGRRAFRCTAAARRLVHLIERPQTTQRDTVPVACRLLEGETVANIAEGAGR